jgi:hypothetical protein
VIYITLALVVVGVLSLKQSRHATTRSDAAGVVWTWLGTLLLGFALLNLVLAVARP